MSDHPNATLARQAWDAVARADVDALKDVWSDDIVWHVMGDSPWVGDHVGCDAVLDYLAQVGESGDTYDATLEDVLVSKERVALLCHVESRRKAHTLDSGYLLMGRIENGKMVEMWTLPLDPEAIRAFWGDEASGGRKADA